MKKSAVIICNGEFPKKEYPRSLLAAADYVICCDGGVEKYLEESISIFGKKREPDIIIGDLDSISSDILEQYKAKVIHIEEQVNNDLTKAFSHIIRHYTQVNEIHILAATGYREDHTIGNISLLMEYDRKWNLDGIRTDMVSDYSIITSIKDSCTMKVGKDRKISIFSPDNSLRIKSKGLRWKTDDVVFDNWWKATLNKSSEEEISLEFNHPSRAIIILDL